MRYIKLLIVILLSNSFSTYSFEVAQDSVSFSEKSIKGISKIIHAYMKDYEATLVSYAERQMSDAESTGMLNYENTILKGLDWTNPSLSHLDSIQNFLSDQKNAWSKDGLKIFNILRQNFDQQINEQNNDLEAVFEIGNENLVYIQIKDDRLNDNANWDMALSSILAQDPTLYSNNSEELNTSPSISEIQPNEGNLIDEDASKWILTDFILKLLVYLGIFIIGCIAMFFYIKNKVKSILYQEYLHYTHEIKFESRKYAWSFFGVIEYLLERKNFYKNDNNPLFMNVKEKQSSLKLDQTNKNLREDIYKLKNELSKVKNQSEQKELETLNEESTIQQELVGTNDQEKKLKFLYYDIPEEDGSFVVLDGKVTSVARSYYKIEYLEGDTRGDLYYRSGNLDASALSQIDYFLKPVCEIENSTLQNPSTIEVLSNGIVLKQEDKWVVDKKIKIKLA